MNGVTRTKMPFIAALSAPILGLLLALVVLAFQGRVERIPPSENVFTPWAMVDEGPESDGMSRALLERPLLWGRRRPLDAVEPAANVDSAPQEPAGPKKPALAGYRLAGMFLSDLDAGVIVIGKKGRHRLIVGESLDGWMLEEIRDDGAVFVNGDSGDSRSRSLVTLEHLMPAAGNQRANRTSTNTQKPEAQEPQASAKKGA